MRLEATSILLDPVMIAIFLGVAFPVHEFAHAFVAYLRGDATAKLFGRMTLNPVVHFDPVGGLMTVVSIFLGGFLIGWAKPTPVNTNNLRNRRNDEVLVALAGPGLQPRDGRPRRDRRAHRVAREVSLPDLVSVRASLTSSCST